MQHCDPDVIGLAALGETIPPREAEHLAGCAQCRLDVAELAGVVRAVRVDVVPGPPVAPPARVWEQIAAQTGVQATPQGLARLQEPAPPQRTAAPQEPVRPIAPVVPLPSRAATRRQRPAGGRRLILAVAASALVVGAAGGSIVTRLLTPAPPPVAAPVSGRTVAAAQLAALPAAPTADGTARVVQAADGPHLIVDVSRLSALSDHFYEVWLIDRSVKKMVPVGILRGSEGEFVIPEGLNLGEYAVVDISVQKPGNPDHSGTSVLRGTLPV